MISFLILDSLEHRPFTLAMSLKSKFYREITAKFGIFTAKSPRNLGFSPRNRREIWHFYRDNTAKFGFLAYRGTAKFGVFYRDKLLPLASAWKRTLFSSLVSTTHYSGGRPFTCIITTLLITDIQPNSHQQKFLSYYINAFHCHYMICIITYTLISVVKTDF